VPRAGNHLVPGPGPLRGRRRAARRTRPGPGPARPRPRLAGRSRPGGPSSRCRRAGRSGPAAAAPPAASPSPARPGAGPASRPGQLRSGRPGRSPAPARSADRSDRGAATTCPVQFMISAVSSPPGVPSTRKIRICLPRLTKDLYRKNRTSQGCSGTSLPLLT
jgi:hypothetical protein